MSLCNNGKEAMRISRNGWFLERERSRSDNKLSIVSVNIFSNRGRKFLVQWKLANCSQMCQLSSCWIHIGAFLIMFIVVSISPP